MAVLDSLEWCEHCEEARCLCDYEDDASQCIVCDAETNGSDVCSRACADAMSL